MLFVNAVDIAIAYYFYNCFLKRKSGNMVKLTIGLFALVSIFTSAVLLVFNIDLLTGLAFLFYFLLAVMGFEGKISIKFIASLFIVVFSFISEFIAGVFITNMFSITLEMSRTELGYFMLGIVVSKLLLMVLVRVTALIGQKTGNTLQIQHQLMILTIPLVSVYLISLMVQSYLTIQIENTANVLIVCISILYINLMTFVLFEVISRYVNENLQYKDKQAKLLLQQEQYENIINGYKEIRSIKHDMVNHMISISGLIANDEINEAKTYIDKLNNMMDDSVQSVITGHVVVDALINNKKKRMEKDDISIDVDTFIPDKISISQMDFSTILGNALDNAIESCERIQDKSLNKSIKLIIKLKSNHLLIVVKNPVNMNYIEIEDGAYVSTKGGRTSDRKGCGLVNIIQSVEHNDGNYQISIEDNIFILKVIIPVGA